ncbi:19992_t:CDS:1, partial [Dentiscutata erythropus]
MNIEMENELAIKQFFDIGMLKRNQKDTIKNNSVVNSQRSTNSTNED